MGWSQSINWESYQRTLKSCASPRQTPRFSFSKCPFCIKAKKELNDMGVPFTALDLDQMDQEVIRKECCCNILNLWNHKCKQSINGNSCKKKQKYTHTYIITRLHWIPTKTDSRLRSPSILFGSLFEASPGKGAASRAGEEDETDLHAQHLHRGWRNRRPRLGAAGMGQAI